MEMIDDILETLQQAATATVHKSYNNPIVRSYDKVTTLILNVLSQYDDPSARKVRKVCSDRALDAYLWKQPIISKALERITDEHLKEIYDATYVLASRLPGKTRIRRRKRKLSIHRLEETDFSQRGRTSGYEQYSTDFAQGEIGYAEAEASDE